MMAASSPSSLTYSLSLSSYPVSTLCRAFVIRALVILVLWLVSSLLRMTSTPTMTRLYSVVYGEEIWFGKLEGEIGRDGWIAWGWEEMCYPVIAWRCSGFSLSLLTPTPPAWKWKPLTVFLQVEASHSVLSALQLLLQEQGKDRDTPSPKDQYYM